MRVGRTTRIVLLPLLAAALCAALAWAPPLPSPAMMPVQFARPAAVGEASNAAGAGFSNSPRLPPQVPDTLHYEAHWKLLPVGSATLSWTEANGQRQIQFTADSNRLVSLFYPVRDHMASVYNEDSMCTESVNNDTVEGRRQRQTRIRYQPALGQLVLDELDLSHRPPVAKHELKSIPGCVEDLFTALDYARGQSLQVGDEYRFPVNEGGKTASVQLAVDMQETITTPAGTFTTVRVVPTLAGGAELSALHGPGRMWIWFSDDRRHIPVQIKATVSWGTILVQLMK